MCDRIEVKTAALSLGAFAFLVHLLWVLAVAAGFGQALGNWRFSLHFVSMQFAVMPFDFVNAIALLITAFILGAVAGALFATLWNHFSKR